MPLITESTDLVTFTVKVNGTAVGTEFRLLEIVVSKEIGRIPFARILISDGSTSEQTFEASSSDTFLPGNEIEILAGYHSAEETLFKGIITRHGIRVVQSRPGLLEVECRHRVTKMSVGRKSRTFYDSTDSDILESIFSEYDLTAEVEPVAVQHQRMVQYQSTDWDFVNLRAEANNKYVIAEDELVRVKGIPSSSPPVFTASYGTNVLEFEADIESRYQFDTVKAESWDPAGQEVASATGNDPGIPGPGNLSSSDLAGVIGISEYSVKHPGSVSMQELQSWADATLTRSRLAKVTGRVTVQGTAAVRPGESVTLEGLGDRINGTAFVSGIKHEISGGNWLTHIQCGMRYGLYGQKPAGDISVEPASGITSAVHGLQTGIVTQLEEDPDGEDRVKVKLPLVNPDEEGIWARICTLDAGNNRGTFFRPEVDDEVIVGFLHDDPNHPVILGMLNSSALPAPAAAADANNEKGYLSRSGMKIWLDDDKKILEISTPAGKKIRLDEDAGEILIGDENNNSIKMNSDGIILESGKDIVLKATGDLKGEGVNVGLKAQAQCKAEGSAGAEISSSSVTVVKGSMVQIN